MGPKGILSAAAIAAAFPFTVSILKSIRPSSRTLRMFRVGLPPLSQDDDPSSSVLNQGHSMHRILHVYLLPDNGIACEQELQKLLPKLLPGYISKIGNLAGEAAVIQQPAKVQCVLGMDAEWQPEILPGDSHKVSVIQIAGADWAILIRPLSSGLPPSLASLLSDPTVIKAGLSIQEDIRRITADCGVHIKGAVDVRCVCQLIRPDVLQDVGQSLTAITAALLGRQLDKGQQRSAWANRKLSKAQMTYAAHDAWAARQILLELHQQACPQQATDNTPPGHHQPTSSSICPTNNLSTSSNTSGTSSPVLTDANNQSLSVTVTNAENGNNHTTDQHSLDSFVIPFLDVHKQKIVTQQVRSLSASGAWPFLAPAADPLAMHNGRYGNASTSSLQHDRRAALYSMSTPGRSSSGSLGMTGSNGDSASVALGKKPARHALRKSKLYENCRIQAPDGAVLCTCSSKKIQWYLDRQLGEIVCDDPLTVRLFFEPRGRGHQDDKYYTADKINQCVVCGAKTEEEQHKQDQLDRQTRRHTLQQQEQQQQGQRPATPVEDDGFWNTDSCPSTRGTSPLPQGPVEEPQQQGQSITTSCDTASTGNASANPGINSQQQQGHDGSGDERNVAASTSLQPSVASKKGTTEVPAGSGAHGAQAGVKTSKGKSRSGNASGHTEAYLRHSIVPHCYRRCFPVTFKSHLSHDIVLLCLECHQVCSVHDQQRMAWLGEQCNAPLAEDNRKFKYDNGVGAVRSAARALLNTKVKVPPARRAELAALIAQHFKVALREGEGDAAAALPGDVLEEAACLDPRRPAGEWSSHAERVVASLKTTDDIEMFVRGWRQHFLDTMKPRHLPPHWSVVSRVANSAAQV